jgi:protein ImuB
MTQWLCAHLPCFRTERITRGSQAPDKLLAIVEERGDSVLIVAGSARATALGITAGMTATAARALAPSLELAAHNPGAEADDLESLAAALYRFTPRVFLDFPRALLLDITGCERLFGGEEELACKVLDLIQRLGYSATLGRAGNPTCAYALALDGCGAGVEAVREAQIAALRLEALDLRHLDALGVRTVGDLLALPLETLPARFSDTLLTRLRQLRGDALEDFPAFHPPAILQERLDFSGPTDRRDSLMFALRRVAVALEERLCALGQGATLLEVSLRAHEGPPVAFSLALSRAARDCRSLTALMLGRMESVDTQERWFDGVEVRVPKLGKLRAPQRDLFARREAAEDQAFTELVDEITGYLGHEAIARAELTADPRPEHSFAWRAFLSPSEPALPPLAPRPLARFEPHEVEVQCDAAGNPACWYDGKRSSRLLAVSGPERVHFGWWKGDGGQRDYHVVEDEGGARWWLERRQERWFIVGAF